MLLDVFRVENKENSPLPETPTGQRQREAGGSSGSCLKRVTPSGIARTGEMQKKAF